MESRKENTPPGNTQFRFFVSKPPSLATINEDHALSTSSLPGLLTLPSTAEQSLSESLQNVARIRALLEEAISNREQHSRDDLSEALTVFGEAINETKEPYLRLRKEYMKITDKGSIQRVFSLLNSAKDFTNQSHDRFMELKRLLKPSPKLG